MLLACRLLSAQPADHGEIVYLPQYPPADAATSDVLALADQLHHAAKPAELVREIAASDLPVVAREKLMFESIQPLADAADEAALELLLEFSQYQPQASYLAPDCRRHREHLMFPINIEASAAATNLYRQLLAGQICNGTALNINGSNRLNSSIDPQLLAHVETPLNTAYAEVTCLVAPYDSDAKREAALIRLLNSNESQSLHIAAVSYAFHHHYEHALVQATRSTDSIVAISALRLLPGLVRTHTTLQLADHIDRNGAIISTAIAALQPLDATVENINILTQLLGDPTHGEAAALAFSRIAPNEALAAASQTLQSSDDLDASMKALILLRQIDSPEARQVIRRFAASRQDDSPEQAKLRAKVATWAAE